MPAYISRKAQMFPQLTAAQIACVQQVHQALQS
jgi:hypothetical protein